jgi:DNA-directed RNA polymerase specialized sigma24 family protein
VDLDAVDPAVEDPRVDLIALDEALTALEARDRRKADLVRLRFFAGLSVERAAEVLGISAATAYSDWSYAKSWLRLSMLGDEPTGRPD